FSSAFFDLERPEHEGILRPGQAKAPGGSHEGLSDPWCAGFGDAGSALAFGARVLTWRQAKVRLDAVCVLETCHVIERGYEGDARGGTHARQRHPLLADRILLGQLTQLLVRFGNLLIAEF